MTLDVWSNFSKRQNSTKQPSGTPTQYSVYMKKDTSLLNPVFVIEGVNLSATYCRLNGRYYFIDDIVLQNNNIYELHCHVDSMATWKSAIGSSTQYILRSAYTYDGDVVDMFYPSKKSPTLYTTAVSPTSSSSWASGMNGGIYIIGVISDGSTGGLTQGSVTYIEMDASNFRAFASSVFTTSNWTDFQSQDRYSFNPIQYIASVMWFPKAFWGRSGAMTSLKLGWETLSGFTYYIPSSAVGSETRTVSVPTHPQSAIRGNYLNFSPYTVHKLSFPPFGDIAVDPDLVYHGSGSTIDMVLKVDAVTGRAILIGTVTVHTTTVEIFRREIQLGVDIRLSQISADRIGAVTTAVNTVGGFLGNVLSGNILGAITGTISGIGSAYQTMMPVVESNGSNDSMCGIQGLYIDPKLFTTFFTIVDEDNTSCGRPLCSTRQISNIPGYILCANAELSIAGFSTEREEIISYMDSGFFYE